MPKPRRVNPRFNGRNDYLKRLPADYYRGQAYVHWSMTIDKRRTGWLSETMHCKFREILTHTLFRYSVCCPIYCCMPDHLHLLWVGIGRRSDQRLAARFFRTQLNVVLQRLDVRLQDQPHDHVLREEERGRQAFEEVAEYIARNPERARLVAAGKFRAYPYTGCLVPGYPDLSPWENGYWERFWRFYQRIGAEGVIRR